MHNGRGPARSDQAGPSQLVEQALRFVRGQASEAGRCRGGEVGTWMQAEEPEKPGRPALSWLTDQEKTARTLVVGSPMSNASRRSCSLLIWAANDASGTLGLAAARAAVIASASGRRAHRLMSCAVAAGLGR